MVDAPMPIDCVVDASVLIKLFVPEDGSESAAILLLGAGYARRAIPDLARIECASVLWKWVKRGMLEEDFAHQSLADLSMLPLDVWPTDELLATAFNLALSCGITVYDAVYVALANRLGCPLLTADAALVRKLADSSVLVRLFDPSPPH